VKYARNPLAKVFGQRYDAIRQRFGKKAGLGEREAFVRYMLAMVAVAKPKIRTARQLRQFQIQRVNRERGFEEGNLELTQRTTKGGKKYGRIRQ